VFNTHGTAPNLQYDIHFWLGDNTTADEAGAAAYKTVELDDFHHGAPVEPREGQSHEAALFVSYFPKGIRVLHGGIEGGFRHVTAEQYKPRLFHLRGNYHAVSCYEVALARDSLNSSDVFVLDDGLKVFQWNGAKSNNMERLKGGQFAHSLRDDRDGKPEVHVFDEDGGSEHFWKILGGRGPIKPVDTTVQQATISPTARSKALFKLEDETGKLVFSKVAEGRLNRNMLQTNSAFVIDAVDQIYIWIGNGADAVERRSSLGYAHKYLEDNHFPLHTPITKIPESATHNVHFNAVFA